MYCLIQMLYILEHKSHISESFEPLVLALAKALDASSLAVSQIRNSQKHYLFQNSGRC